MFDPFIDKATDTVVIAGEEILSSANYAPLSATQAGCQVDLYDWTDNHAEAAVAGVSLTYAAASDTYKMALTDLAAVLTDGHRYSGQITKAGMVAYTIENLAIDNSSISIITTSLNKIKSLGIEKVNTGIGALRNLIQAILLKQQDFEKENKNMQKEIIDLKNKIGERYVK